MTAIDRLGNRRGRRKRRLNLDFPPRHTRCVDPAFREIPAPQQTIASTGSQISFPAVASCSTAWIPLSGSLRDSRMHRGHETTTERSADSFIREFRGFGSRGHGCPRSGQRFTERFTAWIGVVFMMPSFWFLFFPRPVKCNHSHMTSIHASAVASK